MSVRGTSFRVSLESDENGSITRVQTFEGLVESQILDKNGKPAGEPLPIEPGKETIISTDGEQVATYVAELEDIDFEELPPVIAAYIVASDESGNKEYPDEIVEKARAATKKNEESTSVRYSFTFLSEDSDEAEIHSELLTLTSSSDTETSISTSESETVVPETTPVLPDTSADAPAAVPVNETTSTSTTTASTTAETTTTAPPETTVPASSSESSGGGGGGGGAAASECVVEIYDAIYTDVILTIPVEAGGVVSKSDINSQMEALPEDNRFSNRRVAFFHSSSGLYEVNSSAVINSSTRINVETVPSGKYGLGFNYHYPNGTVDSEREDLYQSGYDLNYEFYAQEELHSESYILEASPSHTFITDDTVIEVQCSNGFNVTVNVNSGTAYQSSTLVSNGANLLSYLNSSSVSLYPPSEKVLDYWTYTDSTGTHNVTSETTVTENITATPVYKDAVYYLVAFSYTVDGAYASAAMAMQIPEGTLVNAEYIQSQNLVPTGYTFVSCSTPFTVTSDSQSFSFDITPNEYTVTFAKSDGTTLATRTVKYGESVTDVPDGVDGDNYKFISWVTTDYTNVTDNVTVMGNYTTWDVHAEHQNHGFSDVSISGPLCTYPGDGIVNFEYTVTHASGSTATGTCSYTKTADTITNHDYYLNAIYGTNGITDYMYLIISFTESQVVLG